jgi:hypothetical protein
MASSSNYEQIIEWLFQKGYKKGTKEVPVEREDILLAIKKLKLERPKNLGDVIYSYRYRKTLPKSITDTAPAGSRWVIRGRGDGQYSFALTRQPPIVPSEALTKIKIPDATPGVIAKYALSDEQALLAKLRYNRLIDIFTGIVCYSLQSHLRTKIKGIGQLETDELYIGMDQNGSHYVLPVQAKGHRDRIEIVQIEQDFALGKERFGDLICRPIGAQFMDDDVIALFEFVIDGETVSVRQEKHYRLVPHDQISNADLESYRTALPG